MQIDSSFMGKSQFVNPHGHQPTVVFDTAHVKVFSCDSPHTRWLPNVYPRIVFDANTDAQGDARNKQQLWIGISASWSCLRFGPRPQFNQFSMFFFVIGIRGPKDGMYSDHCVFKQQNHGIHCHDPL